MNGVNSFSSQQTSFSSFSSIFDYKLAWFATAALIVGASLYIFQSMRAKKPAPSVQRTFLDLTKRTEEHKSMSTTRVIKRLELNEKLISEILSGLNLRLTGPVKIPKEGRIATNAIVQTNQGEFVLRLYPEGCQDEKLETGRVDYEVEALNHLASKGVHVPHPMQFQKQGSTILHLDGAKIFVYPVLHGRCIQQEELSEEIADRSARLLHSMIAASSDFKPLTKPLPQGDIEYILKISQRLMQRYPQLAKEESFTRMIEYVQSSNAWNSLEETPKGIVHADFFFENIIYNKDNDTYSIIDFGDAYYGAQVMDIVISSMEFSVLSDGTWDLDMFKASLKPHKNWLNENQIDFELFYELILANCLRFSVYTLPGTLSEELSVDKNPYITRYNDLTKGPLKQQLEAAFNQVVSE